MVRKLPIAVVALLLALPAVPVFPEGAASTGVELSPELGDLLRREMAEIQVGMTLLVPALAAGEWAEVERIGQGIEGSFVLKRSLTPEMKAEIGTLPEEFRRLDRRFHAAGGSLAEAAAEGDAELAVYYTSRLLEGCASCHGRFAGHRFPGFE